MRQVKEDAEYPTVIDGQFQSIILREAASVVDVLPLFALTYNSTIVAPMEA